MNARGQEFDDLETVRHNSIAVLIAAAVVASVIPLVVGVILWILKEPTINGFSPMSGRLGGLGLVTPVTVTGTNFEAGMAVRFGTELVSYSLVSEGEIATQLVPSTVPHALQRAPIPATAPFSVATSIGSVTSASNFTSMPPVPTINNFSPAGGLVDTAVMISGVSLTGATEVTFGGIQAIFLVASDTVITATVPLGSVSGPIQVTTPDGIATSISDFSVT